MTELCIHNIKTISIDGERHGSAITGRPYDSYKLTIFSDTYDQKTGQLFNLKDEIILFTGNSNDRLNRAVEAFNAVMSEAEAVTLPARELCTAS